MIKNIFQKDLLKDIKPRVNKLAPIGIPLIFSMWLLGFLSIFVFLFIVPQLLELDEVGFIKLCVRLSILKYFILSPLSLILMMITFSAWKEINRTRKSLGLIPCIIMTIIAVFNL